MGMDVSGLEQTRHGPRDKNNFFHFAGLAAHMIEHHLAVPLPFVPFCFRGLWPRAHTLAVYQSI